MNVLLIGGTGFIGLPVARRLLRQGHRLAVFHRGRTSADLPEAVSRFYGDRNREADVRAVCLDVRPDAVLDVVPCTARPGATDVWP